MKTFGINTLGEKTSMFIHHENKSHNVEIKGNQTKEIKRIRIEIMRLKKA